MSDNQLLRDKLNTKIQLPIGDVLADSFNLFGKAAGSYIAFLLFSIIAFMFLGVLAALLSWLGIVLLIIISIIVAPGLQVGFARFTKKVKEGKPAVFNDFFSGFKHNLGQLVLQGVLVSVITIGISFGVSPDENLEMIDIIRFNMEDPVAMMEEYLEFSERNSEFSWMSFLGGIFSFYIALGLSLTPYIVSFYNVHAITAMDVSFRMINKVVFQAAAIKIVLSILAVMGALFFIVGLFATVPIMFIGSYLVFRYTIGEKPEEGADDWSVIDHVV